MIKGGKISSRDSGVDVSEGACVVAIAGPFMMSRSRIIIFENFIVRPSVFNFIFIKNDLLQNLLYKVNALLFLYLISYLVSQLVLTIDQ